MSLASVSPFLMRARVVVVGRERLNQLSHRLQFLIVTPDLSENSLEEMKRGFSCPIYQCLSTEEIETLFGYHGTKVIGFKRHPLSVHVQQEIRDACIRPQVP